MNYEQFDHDCHEIAEICAGLRAALNVALMPGRRTLNPTVIETTRTLTAHFEEALLYTHHAAAGGSEAAARQAIERLRDTCAHLKEMALFIPPSAEAAAIRR
jgi:hypothetical protein